MVRALTVTLLFVLVAGCSSITEPNSADLQRNAIIGNWNKFENADVFTPQGFRFQVGFRSDGKYQFITFDFVEISGNWRHNGDGKIVISDNICSSEGTYEYSVQNGTLLLTSVDIAGDGCGRSDKLSGEWLRSGELDQAPM